MNALQQILTRLLPKSGQVGNYRAGDDGIYEAGWWKGTSYPNFRIRFLSKTFAGHYVVIDLATGLMWAADATQAGCNNNATATWNAAIDYANALDFAGFTDWRLPNVRELGSIVDFGLSWPSIAEPPFMLSASVLYWTSTTNDSLTTKAFYIHFATGDTLKTFKTESHYLRCVRGGL